MNHSKPDTAPGAAAAPASADGRHLIEQTGIEVIAPGARKARPRDLFWPWFAANVSVFGMSYGSYLLGFRIAFWQATLVAIVGVVVSFALCGVIAIAGKRANTTTMIVSRAAFGVEGQKLPGLVSWLASIGWETMLTISAVLATATVFRTLGWGAGATVSVLATIFVAGLIVAASVLGYHTIIRLQSWLTWVTGIMTVAFMAFAFPHIDWSRIGAQPAGSLQAMTGALVLVLTGFGLGWINIAADWSRYQRRDTPGGKIVFWNTLGGAMAPVLLVTFGLLLAGSNPQLADAIGRDPIGALISILPRWTLLAFWLVAVLTQVSGAILGIYSSGLTLLSLGVPIPRPAAAALDGAILTAGTVWVVFFADSFIGPFQSFLLTLGVPLAAWAGILMADIASRRTVYDDKALFDRSGRYGAFDWPAIVILIGTSLIGWGLVINNFTAQAPWNNWQGYLLGLVGGKDGPWAAANLGVMVALVLAFFAALFIRRPRVRRQETGLAPLPRPAAGGGGGQ